jgi:outer membrane lipase/esterase
VLIGANDVLELYQRYVLSPTTETLNEGITELQARGARLGQQIEALTQEGPRLIVSTIPLMNQTPYALREAVDRPAIGALNALDQLSRAFNTAVRVNIVNNGQYWGLVELDALINAGATDPSRYGLVNVVSAVCAVELPNCTTNTLVANGNAATWLWASDLWMGTTAHYNLGQFARGRALGNPF